MQIEKQDAQEANDAETEPKSVCVIKKSCFWDSLGDHRRFWDKSW